MSSILTPGSERTLARSIIRPAPSCASSGVTAETLARWLAGTLHDGYTDEYLSYYLDEFTFRFNRRNSRSRGLLWYRLVQQAVVTDPHPLDVLQHKI